MSSHPLSLEAKGFVITQYLRSIMCGCVPKEKAKWMIYNFLNCAEAKYETVVLVFGVGMKNSFAHITKSKRVKANITSPGFRK
jgi:hypothetical protein